MVYCTRCGTLNPEGANNCSNCGAPLSIEQRPFSRHEWRRYYEEEYHYHRHGSGFGLLIAGLFVVFLGLATLFGEFSLFWQYFWPLVLVVIGVWLLLWGLRRNRRYNQPHNP